MFKRGTAVTGLTIVLIDATDGTAVTSGTASAFVTIDGGTQAAATNAPVHEGNGQWSLSLTAAEMTGKIVGVLFTHADAIPVNVTLSTVQVDPDDATDLGLTNLDATVSSRASQASLDTVDNFVDTEITTLISGQATILSTAAAIQAKTDNLPASPAAVGSAMTLAPGSVTATAIATDAIDADALSADAVAAIQAGLSTLDAASAATAVWAAGTRTLTAGTNIVLAKGTGVTGFTDLDAAGIRTAVGLASNDLDTQLGTLPTAAEIVTAIGAMTVEGAITLLMSARGWNAVLLGKANGLDTSTANYRDLADTKNRVVATVDADGNRSAVTRDLS
jgi:hypothetical protein